MKNTFVCILILLCISFTQSLAKSIYINAVQVTDGDTFHAINKDQKIKVRLYGIDCPEKKQDFGKEASLFTQSFLQNTPITFIPLTKDYFGRTVAFVYAQNKSLQAELISNGLAWVSLKYCKAAVCNEWNNLQEQAKAQKKGLWQDQNPMPPWVWRKK